MNMSGLSTTHLKILQRKTRGRRFRKHVLMTSQCVFKTMSLAMLLKLTLQTTNNSFRIVNKFQNCRCGSLHGPSYLCQIAINFFLKHCQQHIWRLQVSTTFHHWNTVTQTSENVLQCRLKQKLNRQDTKVNKPTYFYRAEIRTGQNNTSLTYM